MELFNYLTDHSQIVLLGDSNHPILNSLNSRKDLLEIIEAVIDASIDIYIKEKNTIKPA